MPIIKSQYRSPSWLKGANLQTIWPVMFAGSTQLPQYRREFLTLSDGGRIALDFVGRPQSEKLVALFHGLEGSSASHYAKSLMLLASQQNIAGVVVHFRGCGGVENISTKAYFAGDTPEMSEVLQYLKTQFSMIYAAGVSLGGNILLKYLGEMQAQSLIDGAVAISAPMQLLVSSQQLNKGFWGNLVYTQHFLKTLKKKAVIQWQAHPNLFNLDKMLKANSFAGFDDAVTAPMHGFKNAIDYWTRCSSFPLLRQIQKPTLIINAKNDPFYRPEALPQASQVSEQVFLEQPNEGGHVGFVSGRFPGQSSWLAERIMAFLGECQNQTSAQEDSFLCPTS